MTVRKLQDRDITWALHRCKDMHKESRYRNCNFLPVKMERVLTQVMESELGIALRTEHGLLLGAVNEYWFGTDRYAFEYVLYVTPEHRGTLEGPMLAKRYIKEAKLLGAKEIHIENTTGVETERTERLFLALGFSRIGGNFIMTLE